MSDAVGKRTTTCLPCVAYKKGIWVYGQSPSPYSSPYPHDVLGHGVLHRTGPYPFKLRYRPTIDLSTQVRSQGYRCYHQTRPRQRHLRPWPLSPFIPKGRQGRPSGPPLKRNLRKRRRMLRRSLPLCWRSPRRPRRYHLTRRSIPSWIPRSQPSPCGRYPNPHLHLLSPKVPKRVWSFIRWP